MVQFTINDHTGQLTPSSKSSAFQQVRQTGAEHFPQTKSKQLAHLTFVLLDWHIRPLVCLEGRKSSSSPWRIRFKRNIYWAFCRLLLSAEQRLSPSLMRKSRLEQVDIDISAHIMFVSNAVISTRLKKAARDHLRDAAFVEYVQSISSVVSTPLLVAL